MLNGKTLLKPKDYMSCRAYISLCTHYCSGVETIDTPGFTAGSISYIAATVTVIFTHVGWEDVVKAEGRHELPCLR